MVRNGRGKACLVAAACAATLALSGCKIPFTNFEIPINLPSFDLSGIKLPDISLPIGVTTTVEEARQQAAGAKTPTVSDEALVMPGYLSVGVKTSTSTAPLCVEGDAGSLAGLDIDLGAALASEMGLKVRYVPVADVTSLGPDCDIIMNGSTDNPTSIAIAGTYVETAASFFYKGEATVLAPTDLGGKSVGVQGGSASEAALNASGLKMSQKVYANLNEAFDGLAAGEVDFVLCEAYQGAYLATMHPGVAFAGTLDVPTTSGVAALSSNAELLDALRTAFDSISTNGVLDTMRSRWVGTLPALTSDSQIKDIPAAATTETQTEATEATDDGDGSDAGSGAITSV